MTLRAAVFFLIIREKQVGGGVRICPPPVHVLIKICDVECSFVFFFDLSWNARNCPVFKIFAMLRSRLEKLRSLAEGWPPRRAGKTLARRGTDARDLATP